MVVSHRSLAVSSHLRVAAVVASNIVVPELSTVPTIEGQPLCASPPPDDTICKLYDLILLSSALRPSSPANSAHFSSSIVGTGIWCHLLTMSLPIGASRIVSRALVRQGFGRSGACPSIGSSSSTSRTAALRRPLTTAKPQQPPPPSATATNSIKNAKTRAGTGNMEGLDGGRDGGVAMSMIPRGPVSWASLGLVAVAAASAVAYYQIERERRLENAMGKIVSASTALWNNLCVIVAVGTPLVYTRILHLTTSCFYISSSQFRYQVSPVGVPIRNSLPSDSTRRPSGDGSPSRMHSGAVSAPGGGRRGPVPPPQQCQCTIQEEPAILYVWTCSL